MTGEVFNTVKIPCSKVGKSSLMNVLKTNNSTNQAVYTHILFRHHLEVYMLCLSWASLSSHLIPRTDTIVQ